MKKEEQKENLELKISNYPCLKCKIHYSFKWIQFNRNVKIG